MKIFSINTGFFKLDGGAMHGVVPKSLWQKPNPADELNLCSWAMRCLLIDTGESRILIDCGIGNKQDQSFMKHYYLHGDDTLEKSLAAHGYKPSDITDLFLTHLHFDHCGGAITRMAINSCPFLKTPPTGATSCTGNLRLIRMTGKMHLFLRRIYCRSRIWGKLKFVETHDGGEWQDGIIIRYMQGHTESMMVPIINYNGRNIVFCADLIPSAAHIPLPWIMSYDMQPLKTLKEKKDILELAADNNWVLFFEHDPKIECCTVEHTDKGIRLKNKFKLSEINKY